jgi:hypothetical protein
MINDKDKDHTREENDKTRTRLGMSTKTIQRPTREGKTRQGKEKK